MTTAGCLGGRFNYGNQLKSNENKMGVLHHAIYSCLTLRLGRLPSHVCWSSGPLLCPLCRGWTFSSTLPPCTSRVLCRLSVEIVFHRHSITKHDAPWFALRLSWRASRTLLRLLGPKWTCYAAFELQPSMSCFIFWNRRFQRQPQLIPCLIDVSWFEHNVVWLLLYAELRSSFPAQYDQARPLWR